MARTAGRVADFVAIPWLDELALKTTHVSLSTADPFGVLDPKTVEPPGPVYSRASVTWTRSGRLLVNSNRLVWTGLLQNTNVTHMSGWTAAFNGDLTFAMPIPPLDYSETLIGGLVVLAGELFVGLDA